MNKGSQEDIQSAVGRTIERVARESYGRLVAYLSVHTHDLASAEDALSEALVSALKAWPRDGLPQNPEAWLLTTARHSLIDVIRHQHVVLASEPTLALLKENSAEEILSTEFPDERLKLLFVCAHPAIDPAMHTPLMLQTFWVWMRVVLLTPSLSHRRLWASGSFARRQKSAMVVSSLKFRKSAICRSGSMPCWKLSTLPSESAGRHVWH